MRSVFLFFNALEYSVLEWIYVPEMFDKICWWNHLGLIFSLWDFKLPLEAWSIIWVPYSGILLWLSTSEIETMHGLMEFLLPRLIWLPPLLSVYPAENRSRCRIKTAAFPTENHTNMVAHRDKYLLRYECSFPAHKAAASITIHGVN